MSLKFEDKLEIIEQQYFTHDEPIPFKEDIKIYPVTIKDYYLFYSLINLFTIDKNKDIEALGVRKSHLDYILYLIDKEQKIGNNLNLKHNFINLLSLIFKHDNEIICTNPKCESAPLTYEELKKDLEALEKEKDKCDEMDEQSLRKFIERQRLFFKNVQYCPICGADRRDYYYFYTENNKGHLFVGNTEVLSKEYDELRRLVCYQNIPDFDDDYIDPELKEALDEAAKLRNPDNVQPTLEKQMACVLTGAGGYTYETLKNVTIRKFVLLLRVIDAKLHYMAYRQGELSGLVTFKGELTHWIWGGNSKKKDKLKDVVSVDALMDKFKSIQ